MHPVTEVLLVWLPIVASVWFVLWFGVRRWNEGLSLISVLIDRKFLTVFLYTGALLAIFLSCVRFFSLRP